MVDLIYTIPPDKHDRDSLTQILKQHPEIQFVSLMGIDLGGNATDEKIPIKAFLEDMDTLLNNGVQTDGSSVVLYGIATLNNARVDIIPDKDVNWFVDYNYDYLHEENELPVGTLRIPSFLIHNDRRVDSRSILKKAIQNFKDEITNILNNNMDILNNIGIDSPDEIEKLILTSATELEFWVKTPEEKISVEELSTSQVLKEQYWKRTQGVVRTALERTIQLMDKYGFEPEMGHKEVGGVSSRIGTSGKQKHIMEQLEIDWKYSTTMQAADNELMIRELVGDTFRSHSLEVTFAAKPIEGVAGSGEHTHIGASVKLKNGKFKNIFGPKDMSEDYMSILGYGALMGILKNYEVINPFIASSNNAFNRLKPGFEAPVCIVTSLGKDVKTPSRNRSILVGLIRDLESPMATRFEVRSPNPLSNTYLVLASLYQGMLDGITAVVNSGKSPRELDREISKGPGEEGFYLEKDRVYRSEEDVFEHFSENERNELFGKPPATVVENMKSFDIYEDKKEILLKGGVFTNDIINSSKLAALSQWRTELEGRILHDNAEIVRSCRKLHETENITDLDVVRWEKINSIRYYLMKDNLTNKSLFTRIREALINNDYDLASSLQLEMSAKINEIKDLYVQYKRNLFEAVE
jgi:glutamine synthetase